MGYDGKGQARLAAASDADAAWDAIGRHPAILEGFVAFDHEFSVIIVRGTDDEARVWDSPLNVHQDGLLAASTLPPRSEEHSSELQSLLRLSYAVFCMTHTTPSY